MGNESVAKSFIWGNTVGKAWQSQFLESAGVRIHYLIGGEGRPVVLLHGAFADAESNWFPLMEGPARPYRFVAPDLRGHGLSSAPLRPEAYGGELWRDVLRLMDHLDVVKADVVGYSMGGRLALKLAVERPDRVRSVLVGGAGWKSMDSVATAKFAAALERFDSVIQALDFGAFLPPRIRAAMDRHNPLAAAAMVRGDWSQVKVARRSLETLKPPLHVLVGARDPVAAEANQLADLAPGAGLTVLEGHDHISALAAPEFAQAIWDFLAAVERG